MPATDEQIQASMRGDGYAADFVVDELRVLRVRVAELERELDSTNAQILRSFLGSVHAGGCCPFCDVSTRNVYPFATHLGGCIVEGLVKQGEVPPSPSDGEMK